MARPTVRILSRYILRQHIPPLLYALAALTCAMLVNQVAKQFGNFVGKGLPWGVIFEVFALSIPFIVAMTLPMAVLVAVLYTFSHLAADNEVTAMKASGISVGRILAPVLGGATLIAAIALVWNDQILPRSNHTLRTLLVDIQRKKPTFQLKEQVINEVVAGQFFLRAAGIDLYLTLRDGEMHEIKRTDPEHFNRTFYQTNRIKVAGVSNTFEPTKNDEYRGDREMTICAMQQVVARAHQDLERVRTEAVTAVSAELRRVAKLVQLPPPTSDTTAPPPSRYCAFLGAIKRLFAPRAAQAAEATQAGQSPRTVTNLAYTVQSPSAYSQRLRAARSRAAIYEVEIQKKLAISAACVIFALLGMPLAIRYPRGGVGLVIGTSLAVFSVYYVGLIGGEELGDRLILPPFLAMWWPNLIFLVVAIPLLFSVRRAGSTAHGGDWDELRATLFGWVGRLRNAERG